MVDIEDPMGHGTLRRDPQDRWFEDGGKWKITWTLHDENQKWVVYESLDSAFRVWGEGEGCASHLSLTLALPVEDAVSQ